nr:MAG TPA: head tail joining protein [Caudoviricetes sp.]
MYVNVGELRHHVIVLRPRDAPDDAGNIVEQSRAPYCSCWAKVLPFAAKISDGYAEQVKEVEYRVVVRYREDIRDTDFFQWGNKTLEIKAPPYAMDGRKRWLVIECRELVEDEP